MFARRPRLWPSCAVVWVRNCRGCLGLPPQLARTTRDGFEGFELVAERRLCQSYSFTAQLRPISPRMQSPKSCDQRPDPGGGIVERDGSLRILALARAREGTRLHKVGGSAVRQRHLGRVVYLVLALGMVSVIPVTAASAAETCNGVAATKTGTNGDDTLIGTSGRDIIVGLGGNDTIKGLGGNDLICAGDGDDIVRGNAGKDTIYGGPGNDKIDGDDGKDKLYGDQGNDTIRGGLRATTCCEVAPTRTPFSATLATTG